MLTFILLALTIFRILNISINRKLIISKYRNLIVHSTLGLEPKAPATRSTANEPISSHGARWGTNYNFPRVDERRLDRDCSVRKFKVFLCESDLNVDKSDSSVQVSNILRGDHSWCLITVILFVLSFDIFTWRSRCDKKTRLYS